MVPVSEVDATITRYASVAFDDDTPLLEAGLEALSLLRLAGEAATDDDAGDDATRLAPLPTPESQQGPLVGNQRPPGHAVYNQLLRFDLDPTIPADAVVRALA